MTTESDRAELAALVSQLDDVTERMVAVADRYRTSEASAAVADLDTAERNLVSARRSLTRAIADLT